MTPKPSAAELFGPSGTPRVAVIGAGFGGIAAGVTLTRAGIGTFTIYESSLGIGGTWWDNTYPGAEVDVGSHLYSFSFKPYDWSRTHARRRGGEALKRLQAGEWPAPSTVTDLYGAWAAARADAFGGA